MPPSDDKSSIDELKKSLYSRSAPDVRTRRKLRFNESVPDVKTSWGEPKAEDVDPVLNQRYEDRSMSYLKKILLGSVVFCLIAIGVGAYLFFNGGNLISANNIDITINGPVSIPGGTPVPFDITVSNKNNVDLQLVDLSVDFPAGTTDPADSTKELKNFQELLGDIKAGGSAEKTVSAIMFGEENMQKTIDVAVTYKIKGTDSLFTKTKSYDVLINSSPISLSVDTFKEVSSGQEYDMTVDLKSNSQDTLKNIVLKATYPFGYAFISSDIKPLTDNATWKVGDIPPGGERKITIHGKLTGADNDARVFRFAVGAQSSTDPNNIGTEYVAAEQDMTVEKPFVSLVMTVDGDQPGTDHIGQFDQGNNIVINWTNNLPVSVSNMVLTAKISGSAYDKSTVDSQGGFFQSATDDIVWNQQTNPEFATVGAGDNGSVSFRLTPKNSSISSSQIVNPVVQISANVSADRTQETNVSTSLAEVVSRTIRVASSMSLSGRLVRTVGPFINTGPIPITAERASTFTVIWDVDNTSSAVGNAAVSATLPAYVKWLNNVSPSTENVTYDTNTGKITWQVGNVSTYTLNSQTRREVAFQIEVTPSVNQIGQPLTLLNEATLTGMDSFTNTQLTSTQDYLTSRFSTDPAYKDGDGNVVK